jgi:hypothetical protein
MWNEQAETAPSAAPASGHKEVESIRIEPAKNGGHTVRHSYKRMPVHRKGGPNAGMGYDYPESEEFVFGPDDGDKMIAHVRKHAGVKSGAASK